VFEKHIVARRLVSVVATGRCIIRGEHQDGKIVKVDGAKQGFQKAAVELEDIFVPDVHVRLGIKLVFDRASDRASFRGGTDEDRWSIHKVRLRDFSPFIKRKAPRPPRIFLQAGKSETDSVDAAAFCAFLPSGHRARLLPILYDTTTQKQSADLIIRPDMNQDETEHAYDLDPWTRWCIWR
jgi:hypothetical protein